MSDSTATAVRTQLQETEDFRLKALITGDIQILENLLHRDLIYTHSTGRVDDRQSFLNLVASGATQYLALTHEFSTVEADGKLATTQGSMTLHLTSSGVEKRLETTTRTQWVCHQGQWKLLRFTGEKAS